MLKGFAITPVVLGNIRIGEIVERGGKRMPSKLDHILITGAVQSEGEWVEHPEMKRLKDEEAKRKPPAEGKEVKLRSIPVRILFDKSESNFQSNYNCFDNVGRPICVGNGETAKRRTPNGMEDVSCPGSDICSFGAQHRCKQFGRLIIGLESLFENDPLSGFMFRTTSFNSIRALTARLNYLSAVTGGRMAGMPCHLKMRAKTTAGSMRRPIFYLDLEPVGGLIAATKVANEYRKQFEDNGLSREELEKAVAAGIGQSEFFEDQEEGMEVSEEFFLSDEEMEPDGVPLSEHGVSCTQEEQAEIEKLMQITSVNIDQVFAYLGRPLDVLSSLTPFEAERVIKSLKSLEATKHNPTGKPEAKQAGDEAGASSAVPSGPGVEGEHKAAEPGETSSASPDAGSTAGGTAKRRQSTHGASQSKPPKETPAPVKQAPISAFF